MASLRPSSRILAASLLAVAVVIVVVTVLPQSVNAGTAVLERKVYHPESKSYYELVRMTGHNRRWHHAEKLARQRKHKGVRGHLAIVDSPSVHDFLQKTFKPDKRTWIGLRYWCEFRKSVWVNGKVLSRRDFSIWNVPWDLSAHNVSCDGGMAYYPIFYTAVNEGFRWAGQGWNKNWHYYIAQYPTGGE